MGGRALPFGSAIVLSAGIHAAAALLLGPMESGVRGSREAGLLVSLAPAGAAAPSAGEEAGEAWNGGPDGPAAGEAPPAAGETTPAGETTAAGAKAPVEPAPDGRKAAVEAPGSAPFDPPPPPGVRQTAAVAARERREAAAKVPPDAESPPAPPRRAAGTPAAETLRAARNIPASGNPAEPGENAVSRSETKPEPRADGAVEPPAGTAHTVAAAAPRPAAAGIPPDADAAVGGDDDGDGGGDGERMDAGPAASPDEGRGGGAPPGRTSRNGGLHGDPPDGAADAVADYQARLRAWLERHKRYPRQARRRREQGVVVLRFVADRAGAVLDLEVETSSGHPLLDDAALDMVRRAQPLPEMPPGMPESRAEHLLPVRFALR